MSVNLALFGRCQLTVDGVLAKFATDHARALLAYLAVEARGHDRTALATLLWPEQPEAAARQNLRQALVYLKQALRSLPALDQILEITPKTVHFHPQNLIIDVTEFRQLWSACATHAHSDMAICTACIARLQRAADLYTGEFLQGFFIKNSASFEEWALYVREQFHRQALQIFHTLTLYYETVGDYSQMQHYASRQLGLEPWREEAHRQLMRGLARNGQGTAALAHYAACQRVLREELGVPPMPETTRLYEQIKAGSFDRMTGWQNFGVNAEVPVGKNDTSLPHNLPAQLTPFVGREATLAEILTQLQDPDIRLITLIGPGGMGKTRLALAAAKAVYDASLTMDKDQSSIHRAERANRKFRDGIFFVSLAPISDPNALASAIANALGLNFTRSEPRQTLGHALHNKQMLLILDNFEHLLPTAGLTNSTEASSAIEFVLELLQRAPGLQIIATSRQRLNLRGEHLYNLSGLAFSPQATLADASTWAAVRLFVESARRVHPPFRVSAANLPALLRICTLVEGMPLALEMAAAWTDQLSPAEIARAIEKSIDFLTFEQHDVPMRQRSMRAIFNWSWHLLSVTEQRVLRQLAVFRGGFTREAAESITQMNSAVLLQGLTSLVHKSLLQHTQNVLETAEISQHRYELHELMRQFAQEQLEAVPDEWVRVSMQHSEFYLSFVAMREQRLARNQPREATTEIETELNNVRRAWTWAAKHGVSKALDQSAYSLWQLYLLTGLSAEGVQAFHLAADYLQIPGEEAAQNPARQPAILSKLRAFEAYMLVTQGKYEMATLIAQQAIAMADVCPEGAALGYLAWGQASYHQAQFSTARVQCEQALHYAAHANQQNAPSELRYDLEMLAQLFLGAVARSLGDYVLAKHHFGQCLQLCQRLHKLRGEVHAHINLGFTYWMLRDDAAARQAYDQSLRLARKVSYRWGEGVSLYELAIVVRVKGEYTVAVDLCTQALTIFCEIDDRLRQIYTLSNLIEFYSCMGSYTVAQEYYQQLTAVRQNFQAPDGERVGLLASAMFHHYQGNDEQALEYACQAWQGVQATSSRSQQADALIMLGNIQVGLHRLDVAASSYTQALARYQALGSVALAAEAQAGLACIALAQGDLAQAQKLTEEILAVLVDYPYAGLDEPFPLYLACYQVLATTGDVRASTILQTGYRLLQTYANHILDPGLRRSFLENVTSHRALQQAYAAIGLPHNELVMEIG